MTELDIPSSFSFPNCTKLIAALTNAYATGLQYPKIRWEDDRYRYQIYRQGEKSRNAGGASVNIVQSWSALGWNDTEIWCGSISPTGISSISHKLDREARYRISQMLSAFEADPAAFAKVYGTKTSNCCFCGKDLTDPASVTAGYGPICAGKYGLPWGASKEAAIALEDLGLEDAPAAPAATSLAPKLPEEPRYLLDLRQSPDIWDTKFSAAIRIDAPHLAAENLEALYLDLAAQLGARIIHRNDSSN